MSCTIIRNPKNNQIQQVNAPNGKPSQLYHDVLQFPEIAGDKELALRAWAQVYTPSFKQRFGDWEVGAALKKDANGEPVADYVRMYNPGMQNQAGLQYNLLPGKDITDELSGKAQTKYGYKAGQFLTQTAAAQIVAQINNDPELSGLKAAVKVAFNDDQLAFQVMTYPIMVKDTMTPVKPSAAEQEAQVSSVMNKLTQKFENLRYQWISPEEINSAEHRVSADRINAFVKDGVIYLVKGRVTPEIAMEELLHPFVELLSKDKQSVFLGLYNSALKLYPDIITLVNRDYGSFSESDRRKEVVTRALQRALQSELADNEERSIEQLKYLLTRFFEWLESVVNDVFGSKFGLYRVSPYKFPEGTTLASIAGIINTKGVVLPTASSSKITYNISEVQEEENFFAIGNKNVERIQSQLLMIQEAMDNITSPEDVQKMQTLEKLYDHLEDLQNRLLAGDITISATRLSGGGALDLFTSSLKYQNFGNFAHEVIEEVQRMYNKDSNVLPSRLVNESLLNRLLDNQVNKKPEFRFKVADTGDTDIVGLDKKELLNILRSVVQNYEAYILKGYTILPEITIGGVDRSKRTVISRIDTLAISPEGKVVIIDLKTKKVYDSDNWRNIHTQLNKRNPVEASADSDPEFFLTPADSERSTYQNWDIQLGVYAQIFKQLGFEVEDKVILGLLYTGENTYSLVPDSLSNTVDWRYKNYMIIQHRSESDSYANATDKIIFEKYRNIISKVLPIAERSAEEKKDSTNIIFNLTEKQEQELIKRITNILDGELQKIRSNIKKYKESNDEESELIKSLKDRREALMKVKDILEKRQDWETGYKLSLMLNYLKDSYSTINKTVQEIKNEPDLNKKALYLDAMRRRATGLNYFINELERMLVSIDPVVNKQALDIIGEIKTNMQTIVVAYNELGADFMVKVLKDMRSEFSDSRMTKQREEALKPRIEYLKRKIDEAKNGTGVSALGRLKFWATGSLGNKIKNLQGIPTEKLDYIKSLELQLKALELELEGIETTDESLRKFVEGVLENEKSLLYMGRNVTPVTDFIAGASNADFGISAFTNFLKAAEQDAIREYTNFIERNGFQKKLNEFAKGETDINKLSERIQEVRTVKEESDEGVVDKQYLSLIDPVTEEYRNIFKDYYRGLREIGEKLRAGNLTDDERKALTDQKSALMEQHRSWRLQNTQMPLVREVYELENYLPESYRSKRRELLEERDAIMYRMGFNNEEMLTEEDLLEVNEIEVELQRLKLETIKDNIAYEEYIQKLEKYYTYETNWNYFNRIMNSKKIQYGEDSEDFRKWMDLNAYKVPNDDYYDTIGDIYEEMFTIMESDEEMRDLRARQRELLQKVRNRGAADVRFLSAAERAEYMELEELLQEIRESKPKMDLDQYERQRLQELRLELSRLKTTTTNPYYQKEFGSRKQALDQKFGLVKQAEERAQQDPGNQDLSDQLQSYLDSFLAEEEEFEQWYSQNHSDPYESRMFTTKPLNPRPFRFNIVDIPVKPEHYDLKPINKYSIRKLKDAAKNTEYKEDIYGYPLPLSLQRQGVSMSIVDPSSKWINPNYTALTRRQDDFKFYTFMTELYLSTQLETYGNKLGYLVPGFEEEAIKNYQKMGIKEGAKKNFQMWKDKNYNINTPYDYDINDMSTDIERIRFKHNKPLDISEQSGNSIGSIIKWFEEAHINKSVGTMQPMVNAAISYMESLAEQLNDAAVPDKELRKNELNRVISAMKFEYNKIIKGESKDNQGSLGKLGDLLMKGLGFTRMGFDFPNQIGNLFSGNVQIFLGGHKTSQYNNRNLVNAKKQMWGLTGLMPSLIRDVNKISGKSFKTKMYLYFNPIQGSLGQAIDKSMNRNDRLKQSLHDLEFAFWIQDKGEVEIASTIWLAMMDNRLVKYTAPDGTTKMVPAYDAYGENAEGEIIIKPGYAWTRADENELIRNMYSEIRRTQGNYADIDKTKVEKGVMGRFLMYYRKYLMPSIQNRFGNRRDNYEGSEIAMGYYNALFHAVRYYGYGETFKSLFNKSDKVSGFYAQRNQWAAREMLIATIMTLMGNVLAGMVKSLDDNDDDELAKLAVYHMLNVYLKVERETRGLVPLPGIGGIDDYLTQLTNFTNVGSDLVKIYKLLVHGLALGAAQVTDAETIEKAAYYQRKSGQFKKGDAKVQKDLMEVTGWMNISDLFTPEERVEQAFKRR
jgi:hypothetical protein